ncbi:MAG TPA: hypothetical protein DDX92_02850 [Flavobacteriales bacterium]|jgi:hypothetical protein|nr:hypothetical protein [Flavobacteriales bacterium]
MRLSVFNIRKPKRFDYTPRYYDERKENLEQRIAQIKREMDGASPDYDGKDALRGRIRQAWNLEKERKSISWKSNVRVFVIAAILFIAFYIFFYSDIKF